MSIFITLSVYGRKDIPIIDKKVEIAENFRVIDLLHKLEERKDLPRKFGSGEGFSELIVFVNGINAMVGTGLEMVFKDLDNVVVLPALVGG